jgi:hypothetical protein
MVDAVTKTIPEWIKQGYRPHGPYACRCPRCSKVISTNALARRNHQCESSKPRKEEPRCQ